MGWTLNEISRPKSVLFLALIFVIEWWDIKIFIIQMMRNPGIGYNLTMTEFWSSLIPLKSDQGHVYIYETCGFHFCCFSKPLISFANVPDLTNKLTYLWESPEQRTPLAIDSQIKDFLVPANLQVGGKLNLCPLLLILSPKTRQTEQNVQI